MMKSWKVFKSSLPIYLCASENSSFMQKDNIMIAKSGIDSHTCNFAIIENDDPDIQKRVIRDNFKQDGLIFSLPQYKNSIDSWIDNFEFEYLGRAPMMTKTQDPDTVSLKHYDNMRIERVLGGRELQDFLDVFAETRNISLKQASTMFPEPIATSIYFLYVAYYIDEPAGIFIAINTKDGGFVADVDVKSHLRNSNILNVMADRVAYDAVSHGVTSYSTIITSKFANNVVKKHHYTTEEYCDIWRRWKKEKVNG